MKTITPRLLTFAAAGLAVPAFSQTVTQDHSLDSERQPLVVAQSDSWKQTRLVFADATHGAKPMEKAANTPGADNDTRVRDEILEEVFVTALKRKERLIDVPQSVSVLSADYLEKINAVQFRDFADTVPGLSFNTSGAGRNQISLRGVSTGIDTSATVGVYFDEVPYGSSSAFTRGGQLALDVGLFDIDRIEVLRGPQGTLYGASSMGGLLKYVTKRPDSEGFRVELGTGLFSTRHGGVGYHGAAGMNAPIVPEKAALRVSAYYAHDGGYTDNLSLGQEDVDRSDIYGGRADFLFTPTEALSVRLTGVLQNISRNGSSYTDFMLTGEPADRSLEQRRLFPEPFHERFRLVSGTVAYSFGPATLTSISSYQTVETPTFFDVSLLFVPIMEQFFGRSYRAMGVPDYTATDKFTQEVRLASEQGKSIEWLIGSFYTHEDSTFDQKFELLDITGQPAQNDLLATKGPSMYEEYAAFGDLTWHLTDRFDVTGGVRYARNRQETGGGTHSGLFTCNCEISVRNSREDVFTYLGNARYHFSDHATGYMRYATGYRPGGPTGVVATDPSTGAPVLVAGEFEADELKSYEVGYKAETASRRFGFDLATYYIDWSNIQLVVVRRGFGTKVNAPDGARVRGAELTITANPTPDFTISGAFAYQDAEMLEANSDLGAAKGERLPSVPRFTATLNADYELPLGGGWRPMIGATLRYIGDRMATFNNSTSYPQYRAPEYTTLDLRAGFTVGSVDLQLFGRNLLDKRGQLMTIDVVTSAAGPTVGIPLIQPRTFGVTASTKFY